MKKLLLATAVAALSVSAAHAAPTVYGKAFLTLDAIQGDTDVTNKVTGQTTTLDDDSNEYPERTQLNSIGSRIGLKGGEALTANTDLVYQLEYGIDVDENSQQFYSRDTYLGLSNKQYGTLLAGRLTPIDDMVNYSNVAVGGVLGGDDVLTGTVSEITRANNAMAYVSPNYNGLNFLGMYVLDENNDSDTLGRDAYGVGVQYEPAAQPFRAGATYIQSGDAWKHLRVSGAYNVNSAITLGALVDAIDHDTDDNELGLSLSGQMKTATPWTAYAQVDMVSNVGGNSDSDALRVLGGGKYAFNKATTGHIYGAYLNTEEETVNTKVEYDGFGVGAGLEYKF